MCSIQAGPCADIENRSCVSDKLIHQFLVPIDRWPPVDPLLPVNGLANVRTGINLRVRVAHPRNCATIAVRTTFSSRPVPTA